MVVAAGDLLLSLHGRAIFLTEKVKEIAEKSGNSLIPSNKNYIQ